MKILALTGGIATGKTAVARLFERHGALVIDADRAAHRAYRPGTKLHRDILRRYGSEILAPDGTIDRKKLGAILFRSKPERLWLEARIHPETRRLIGREIQAALRRGRRLILVEAALHVETDYHRPFHGLIVVDAPPRVQIERLMRREDMSRAEALAKIRSQMPRRRKLAAADWVIDNSGNLAATERQVRKLIRELQR